MIEKENKPNEISLDTLAVIKPTVEHEEIELMEEALALTTEENLSTPSEGVKRTNKLN